MITFLHGNELRRAAFPQLNPILMPECGLDRLSSHHKLLAGLHLKPKLERVIDGEAWHTFSHFLDDVGEPGGPWLEQIVERLQIVGHFKRLALFLGGRS